MLSGWGVITQHPRSYREFPSYSLSVIQSFPAGSRPIKRLSNMVICDFQGIPNPRSERGEAKCRVPDWFRVQPWIHLEEVNILHPIMRRNGE